MLYKVMQTVGAYTAGDVLDIVDSELYAIISRTTPLQPADPSPRVVVSGTAHILTTGDGNAGYGSDVLTLERGLLVKYVNRTGGVSVKGTLLSASTTANREVILQNNQYDVIAVCQQSGVAEGSEMWCWTIGSVCQVLYKDTTAATRGNILVADAVDGRGSDLANPGGGLPGTDTHFTECGHVLESKDAGTNVLVLCAFHTN